MTNEESQQLQGAMWDLVYGLLSDNERQALVVRIKSDPDAARLYAKVRLQADLIAEAARIEDSSLALSATGAAPSVVADQPTPAAPRVVESRHAKTKHEFHRGGAWLAGAAATALAALLAVGLFWPRQSETQLARTFVATDIMAPKSMPAGVTSPVTLRTYFISASGEALDAVPATLELRLLDQTGRERFRKAAHTNDIGHAKVEIPGEMLQPGVRIEVSQTEPAMRDRDAELRALVEEEKSQRPLDGVPRAVAELPVQPEPQMAYFLLAEPMVNPDKAVPFSLWNFAAFSAQSGPADQAQAALNSVADVTIENSVSEADSQGTLLNGVLQLKQSAPAPAAPAVTANQPVQPPADARLRRAESLAEGSAKSTAPAAAARRQAAGQAGAIAQQGQAGRFAAQQGEPVATTPAGQPIEVVIPSDLRGKELLAAAICRGVTVASTAVAENKTRSSGAFSDGAPQSREYRLSIPVPPEADGMIEIALFDREKSALEPVHREYVYREPLRKLQIALPDLKSRFSPGEQVQLTLRVTDENGRPAAGARVGARVWNEQLVQQSAEQPVLLADAVRAGGEAFNQASDPASGQIQQQLAGGRRQSASSPPVDYWANESQVANDKRAGEDRSAAIDAQEPIELASNRQDVQAAIRKAAIASQSHRQRTMELIGGASIFGGIAALLLLGMLMLLRMATAGRVAAPVLVTALASLVLGTIWIGWLPQPQFGRIAMAPAASAARVAVKDEESKSVTERSDETVDLLQAAKPAAAPSPDATVSNEALDRKEPQVRVELSKAGEGQPPVSNLAVTEPAATAASPARAQATLRALAPAEQARESPAGAASLARGAPGQARSGGYVPSLQGPVLQSNRGTAGGEAVVEAAAKKSLDDRPADKVEAKGEATTAPAALYFNPQLVTDASGRASVQFVMPPVQSQYRLLIDALGQGRIGSRQEILSCEAAAAK